MLAVPEVLDGLEEGQLVVRALDEHVGDRHDSGNDQRANRHPEGDGQPQRTVVRAGLVDEAVAEDRDGRRDHPNLPRRRNGVADPVGADLTNRVDVTEVGDDASEQEQNRASDHENHERSTIQSIRNGL